MESKESSNPVSGKALYETPRLIVYGNVRDITLTTGKNRQSDGGGAPNKNTLP